MYKLDQPSLLFESSRPGRLTAILPECDVPARPLDERVRCGEPLRDNDAIFGLRFENLLGFLNVVGQLLPQFPLLLVRELQLL